MTEDIPVPMQIAEVILSPNNMHKVMYILRNPFRELIKLHMEFLADLGYAFVAGAGDPNDTLFAISYTLLNHMDDPIKALQIMVKGTYHEIIYNRAK